MRVANLLFSTCACACACTDFEPPVDAGVGDLDGGAQPAIFLHPDEIDFGQVVEDETFPPSETVEVCNVGQADLHLQDIDLQDPDSPFAVVDIQAIIITPDECSWFEVRYEPDDASSAEDHVWVRSDDPDEPIAEVHVLGAGLAS